MAEEEAARCVFVQRIDAAELGRVKLCPDVPECYLKSRAERGAAEAVDLGRSKLYPDVSEHDLKPRVRVEGYL
jgi:hypothetical protein